MRITQEDYPYLNKPLEKIPFCPFEDIEKLRIGIELHINPERFNSLISSCKNKVQYIASTLFEPIERYGSKLLTYETMRDYFGSGILVFQGGKYCYYDIKMKNLADTEAEVWVFYKEFLFSYCKRNLYSFDSWIRDGKTHIHINDYLFKEILAVLLFIKHAEIEIKNLPPNRQIWDGQTCIYNNKTNTNIQVIDSTWFTTLVKSDAFKVRGHFRLQPCGDGKSKRKLVWINEFNKDGYTRKARKIDNDRL
jgi:hypothetical protein